MTVQAPTGFDAASALRRALEWFLELRLWVASSVTLLSIYCQETLGGSWRQGRAQLPVIIFFATLALYNLDRGVDGKGGRLGSSHVNERHAFKVSPGPSPGTHLLLSLGSLLVLMPLVSRLNRWSLSLLVLGFSLCSSYALPWGRRTNRRRLKSIPGVKAPFVGFAVAIAVVWVPLLAGDGSPFSPAARISHKFPVFEALILTVTLGLLCTVNALLFDVPDIDEDRERGVPTAALRWGIRVNRYISLALCLFAGGLAWLGLADPLPLTAMAGFLGIAATKIDETTTKTTVAFWVDGGLLLPLGVLVLGSIR